MRVFKLLNTIYKINEIMGYRIIDIEAIEVSFEIRLRIQKLIYLAQELGLKQYLGYSFGWYNRGPFSEDLAFDLIILNENIDVNKYLKKEEYKNVLKNLTKLKEIIESKPSDVTLEDWLECLASLHFVYKHGYPEPKSDSEAIKITTRRKKRFSHFIEYALTILRKCKLL